MSDRGYNEEGFSKVDIVRDCVVLVEVENNELKVNDYVLVRLV